MNSCEFNFTSNQLGICGYQIANAAKNMFQNQNMFMNCTDTTINYSITLDSN